MSINSNQVVEIELKLKFLQELRALVESEMFSGATRESYAVKARQVVDSIYRDLDI